MSRASDPDRFSIRRATIVDLAVIVEMRLAMIGEITELMRASGAPTHDVDLDAMRAPSERWVGEHIDRDFLAWIADVDGRPAGSLGLMWFMHPPGPTNSAGTEAYLLNVYTRPEARGMGLATALMDRAFEAARAAGVKRVWLRTSDAGRPLYESLGFSVEDDGMRLDLE
jgi:GNAT superfamily N-acetyltransferase